MEMEASQSVSEINLFDRTAPRTPRIASRKMKVFCTVVKVVFLLIFIMISCWAALKLFGSKHSVEHNKLECYSCRSCNDTIAECSQWKDVQYDEYCSSNPSKKSFCMKGEICYRTSAEYNASKFTVRGCFSTKKVGCGSSSSRNTTRKFCYCSENLCNF